MPLRRLPKRSGDKPDRLLAASCSSLDHGFLDPPPRVFMTAFMVCHARLRQTALWRCVAVDAGHGLFAPLDVHGPHLGEEIEARIGKMVVDPPRQLAPVALCLECIPERRDDNASGRAHAALGIAAVPDVVSVIRLVSRAVVAVLVALGVDRAATIGGSDGDTTEAIL